MHEEHHIEGFLVGDAVEADDITVLCFAVEPRMLVPRRLDQVSHASRINIELHQTEGPVESAFQSLPSPRKSLC